MSEGPPGTGEIDTDVLDQITDSLRANSRVESVEVRPPYAPSSILVDFDTGYYPRAVERAYLRIRWFETDDFGVHYSEQYVDRDLWEVRWDRHPNDHNTRGHIHPPPDAATPGEDVEFSTDWRDVLSTVLSRLDERIQSFWE
jgi:hypothetical protein